MVSDRAKNPGGPTTDKAKRSSPLEAIPHRPRKRSLSTMLTAKDEFKQEVSREQAEATRILTKTPLPSTPVPSSRHSDSSSTKTGARPNPKGGKPLSGGPYEKTKARLCLNWEEAG